MIDEGELAAPDDATPIRAPVATRCNSCGQVLVAGQCTFCPRPRPAVVLEPPTKGTASWPVPVVIIGCVLVAALVAVIVQVAALRTQVSNLSSDVLDAQTTHDEDLLRIGELEARVSSAETGAGEIGTRVAALESHADPAAVAAAVQPSVFTIEAGGSLGSGFVVASDGVTSTLATNYHVVAEAYEDGDRTVGVLQEGASFTGYVDRVAPGDDLALVTVEAALPVLRQSHDVPRPGAPVLVIGSPLGLGGSVSTGAISALRPIAGVSYIQFSAPISPGNSGGPLVDEQGLVVGITVAKVIEEGADGIGFAIPVPALCTTFQVCT